jgi:hypothetical protein
LSTIATSSLLIAGWATAVQKNKGGAGNGGAAVGRGRLLLSIALAILLGLDRELLLDLAHLRQAERSTDAGRIDRILRGQDRRHQKQRRDAGRQHGGFHQSRGAGQLCPGRDFCVEHGDLKRGKQNSR